MARSKDLKRIIRKQHQDMAGSMATTNALLQENEQLREVVESCAGSLERTDLDAPEDAAVRALCERVGYGAVMDAAARLWGARTILEPLRWGHAEERCGARLRIVKRIVNLAWGGGSENRGTTPRPRIRRRTAPRRARDRPERAQETRKSPAPPRQAHGLLVDARRNRKRPLPGATREGAE